MNILSLFDGISCGQLALNRAGINYSNYFASEIDKNAISVTQYHFPNTIQLGDVALVKAANLPKIDLIIGGSPCTSFSFAGKMEGFNGESKLFYEYVRLLKECSPKYFLLENVKMKKEWQDIISKEMGVEPIFICSSSFSAQKRKRLYWTNIPISTIPNNQSVLEDILGNEAPQNHYLSPEQIERGIFKHSSQKIGKHRVGSVKFPTPRNEKSKCLNTVRIKGDRTMTHVQDDLGIRLLTVGEYERLQTLPVGYCSSISELAAFKAIGNSWTIDVISHIFQGLKQK